MVDHTLKLRPRARLIRTIGDRLISGPEAAVIELVKNSHDADASYVRVTFIPPLTTGSGSILVEDDGHGMTINDIRNRWMVPATTDKIERHTSPGGRRLLGSKGIGRFATARLGNKLKLSTTAITDQSSDCRQTATISEIDWLLFDQVEYLEDISFECSVEESSSNTGAILEITELRDAWTKARLEELHKELRRCPSSYKLEQSAA